MHNMSNSIRMSVAGRAIFSSMVALLICDNYKCGRAAHIGVTVIVFAFSYVVYPGSEGFDSVNWVTMRDVHPRQISKRDVVLIPEWNDVLFRTQETDALSSVHC
jgi:hypothetical protein